MEQDWDRAFWSIVAELDRRDPPAQKRALRRWLDAWAAILAEHACFPGFPF
jgi:hypothetical protein